MSQECWLTPITLVLRRLKEEECKFPVSLSSISRPVQRGKKNRWEEGGKRKRRREKRA